MRRAAAVAGAAAFGLAGCGGGLSHDEFVQRADAICTAYDAQVKLLTRPSSYDEIVTYVEKTLPIYVGAINELSALEPPARDRAAVHDWLTANRRVAAAVRTLRAAALRHDPAATNDASAAVQAASNESRRAASALGLKTCAAP